MGKVLKMFPRQVKEEEKEKDQNFDFESSISQNIKKEERLKKERSSQNRTVLRSYRIKN